MRLSAGYITNTSESNFSVHTRLSTHGRRKRLAGMVSAFENRLIDRGAAVMGAKPSTPSSGKVGSGDRIVGRCMTSLVKVFGCRPCAAVGLGAGVRKPPMYEPAGSERYLWRFLEAR